MGKTTIRNPLDTSKTHRGTKSGKSNWDKHSFRRSVGPVKKDARMKYRKWKRYSGLFILTIISMFFEFFNN